MNSSQHRPAAGSGRGTAADGDDRGAVQQGSVPSDETLIRFLEAGKEAARAAGDVLIAKRGRVHIEYKSGFADLVTEADRRAEQAVIDVLKGAFPDHGFIGEESGRTDGAEAGEIEYRWIIDPLDGTTNFAQGLPLFATSIGLMRGDDLLVGVIHAPALQATYTARRGGGAFANGEPIRVSDTGSLEQSLLVTGFVPRMDIIRTNAPRMQKFIGRTRGVRNLGSAALNLAYVAHGMFEAYWAPANEVWDVAAGVVIVEEAGGVVTDMEGGRLDLFKPRLLATNGRLHDEMIRQLQDD